MLCDAMRPTNLEEYWPAGIHYPLDAAKSCHIPSARQALAFRSTPLRPGNVRGGGVATGKLAAVVAALLWLAPARIRSSMNVGQT